MKTTFVFATIASATVLASSPAAAITLGTNITIADKHSSGSHAWYAAGHEDEETEPGTIHTQDWDLEGMFLDGNKLTLVGGFDFKNGVNYNGHNYGAGDLFIDIDGDARFGSVDNGASGTGGIVTQRYGYDFAFDLDFNTMTFDIIALDSDTRTNRGSDIAASNPWRYYDNGESVLGHQDIAFNYYSGLSSADVGGFLGTKHYAITLDVSYFAGMDATFHNTMSCGNDNLMGRAHVPDTTATLGLFGVALLGLGGLRRFVIRA